MSLLEQLQAVTDRQPLTALPAGYTALNATMSSIQTSLTRCLGRSRLHKRRGQTRVESTLTLVEVEIEDLIDLGTQLHLPLSSMCQRLPVEVSASFKRCVEKGEADGRYPTSAQSFTDMFPLCDSPSAHPQSTPQSLLLIRQA